MLALLVQQAGTTAGFAMAGVVVDRRGPRIAALAGLTGVGHGLPEVSVR